MKGTSRTNVIIKAAWSLFSTYWNVLLGLAALAGLLAAEIWPPLKSERDYFLLLGLTALVATVVEIKLKLDHDGRKRRPSETAVFPTMRAARQEILALQLQEIRKGERGTITIVGGRIRSIIEMMRELADALANNQSKIRAGAKINLFMMSPAFVEKLVMPGNVSEAEQRKRAHAIAAQIRAAVAELESLAESEVFLRHGIIIELCPYHAQPFGYYFLFGNECFLFGGYVWNERTSDIDGPSSPCWLVNNKAPEFRVMAGWLENRALLLRQTGKSSEATVASAPANASPNFISPETAFRAATS